VAAAPGGGCLDQGLRRAGGVHDLGNTPAASKGLPFAEQVPHLRGVQPPAAAAVPQGTQRWRSTWLCLQDLHLTEPDRTRIGMIQPRGDARQPLAEFLPSGGG